MSRFLLPTNSLIHSFDNTLHEQRMTFGYQSVIRASNTRLLLPFISAFDI